MPPPPLKAPPAPPAGKAAKAADGPPRPPSRGSTPRAPTKGTSTPRDASKGAAKPLGGGAAAAGTPRDASKAAARPGAAASKAKEAPTPSIRDKNPAEKVGDATAAKGKSVPLKAPPPQPPKSGMAVGMQVGASFMGSAVSAELSAAIQAAAKAAAATAVAAGFCTQEQSVMLATAALDAAAGVLDPSGASVGKGEEGPGLADRIENSLARAIKQNAMRTMDIFRDWDTNGDGTISKVEFNKALKAIGVQGDKEVFNELFSMWDVDGSGALDYKELDKAIRKAQGKVGQLTAELEAEGAADDSSHFAAINATALKGGVKAANIQVAKAQAQANRDALREKALSPRAQQLKEVAETQAAQAKADEELRIAMEDEDHTTWTVPKFLASKGISKVVSAALDLPPRVSGDTSHFEYTKGLTRERVTEVLTAAKLEGLIEFVYASAHSLTAQRAASAAQLNDKFSSSAKFQMTYGSLSLFYGGKYVSK